VELTGIITQGQEVAVQPGFPEMPAWVTSYVVLYSTDGVNFFAVPDLHGNPQQFQGNYDSDSHVQHIFAEPIEAQYIRVQPLTWANFLSFRFELLGCRPFGNIPDGETQTTTPSPTPMEICPYGTQFWTPFMSAHHPDTAQTGVQETETYDLLSQAYNLCGKDMVDKIICRESATHMQAQTGGMVTCDLENGLVCNNAMQPDHDCVDYEVSFHCNCGGTGQANNPLCVDGWTPWISTNEPAPADDFMGGETESLALIASNPDYAALLCGGDMNMIADIQCREVASQADWQSTGALDLQCDTTNGFYCSNSLNYPVGCEDFEISVLCQCGEAPTGVITETTKPLTTQVLTPTPTPTPTEVISHETTNLPQTTGVVGSTTITSDTTTGSTTLPVYNDDCPEGTIYWTPFYNSDTPTTGTDGGDHETYQSIVQAYGDELRICDEAMIDKVLCRHADSHLLTIMTNDEHVECDLQNGLVCLNSMQSDGIPLTTLSHLTSTPQTTHGVMTETPGTETTTQQVIIDTTTAPTYTDIITGETTTKPLMTTGSITETTASTTIGFETTKPPMSTGVVTSVSTTKPTMSTGIETTAQTPTTTSQTPTVVVEETTTKPLMTTGSITETTASTTIGIETTKPPMSTGVVTSVSTTKPTMSTGIETTASTTTTTLKPTTVQTTTKPENPAYCVDGWTPFMNSYSPDNIGDIETYSNLREIYEFCPVEMIDDIDCRVAGFNMDYALVGQNGVMCNENIGFICDSSQQDGTCMDYEIRVHCRCSEEPTTTTTPGTVIVSTTGQITLTGVVTEPQTEPTTIQVDTTTKPEETTTTKPVEETTPQTTTVSTLAPAYCPPGSSAWTPFMSADSPIDGNDIETIDALREKYSFCEDYMITNIVCRREGDHITADMTSQNVLCHPQMGLTCYSADNNGQNCYNFEVSFFCDCNLLTTTTPRPVTATQVLTTTKPITTTQATTTTKPIMTTQATTTQATTATTKPTTIQTVSYPETETTTSVVGTTTIAGTTKPTTLQTGTVPGTETPFTTIGGTTKPTTIQTGTVPGTEGTTTTIGTVTGSETTTIAGTTKPTTLQTGTVTGTETPFTTIGGTTKPTTIQTGTVPGTQGTTTTIGTVTGSETTTIAGTTKPTTIQTGTVPGTEGTTTTIGSVTTKPTTQTMQTAPQIACIQHGWSDWMNVDRPNNGNNAGDIESIDELRKYYTFCANPTSIKCREVGTNTQYDATGDGGNVCNLVTGFQCTNDFQWDAMCSDYEVSVYCDCQPVTTIQTLSTSQTFTTASQPPVVTTTQTQKPTTQQPTTVQQNPDLCVDGWTPWMSSDEPGNPTDTTEGDEETFSSLVAAGYNICGGNQNMVTSIECREIATGADWQSSGAFGMRCDLYNWFYCRNAFNYPVGCEDYEIRVYCQCSETTTISTTTTKPLIETESTTTKPVVSTTIGIQTTPQTSPVTTTAGVSTFAPVCTDEMHGWTPWMNSFYPNPATGGDFETFDNLREQFAFCANEDIISIECRDSATGLPFDQTGQNGVKCDINSGLQCLNTQQFPIPACADYEIRVYCLCREETTVVTPIILTTTTAQVTTTKPVTTKPVTETSQFTTSQTTTTIGVVDTTTKPVTETSQFTTSQTSTTIGVVDTTTKPVTTKPVTETSQFTTSQTTTTIGVEETTTKPVTATSEVTTTKPVTQTSEFTTQGTTTTIGVVETTTKPVTATGVVTEPTPGTTTQVVVTEPTTLKPTTATATTTVPENPTTTKPITTGTTTIAGEVVTTTLPIGEVVTEPITGTTMTTSSQVFTTQSVPEETTTLEATTTKPITQTFATITTPAPTFAPQCLQDGYTPWFNLDKPNESPDDIGDIETLDQIREQFIFCDDDMITKVECQMTMGNGQGISSQNTGQLVTCDITNGLTCLNAANQPTGCYDYEIRFYCLCSGTTPLVETTTAQTTATQTTIGQTTTGQTTPKPVSTTTIGEVTSVETTPLTTAVTLPPLCLENVAYWTPYMNMDRPNTNNNGGDIETLEALRQYYSICPTEMIDDVECLEAATMSAPNQGSAVMCSPTLGLICLNSMVPNSDCEDYVVRFHCACGPETTTATQTTGQTTTKPEGTTTTVKPGTLTPTLETTTLHPVTTTFGEVTPTEEVVTFTTTTSGEPSTTIAVTSPTTTKPTTGVVTEQTTTTGVVTQTSIVTEKPTPTTTTGTTTTQTKPPTTPVQTTTPNNEPCREPMGLENGLIKPDQITASSHLDDQHRPEDVVLNNPTGAWRPVTNDQTQYLQVDLGELTHVTGFITQGEPETTNYVTTYYITFSTDGVNFVPYTDDGKVVTFPANTDSTTPVTNLLDLSRPITAQYIQIHPVTWNDNIALQAEILGCGVTPTTTVSSTETTPGTTVISTTLSTPVATTLGTTIQTTQMPSTILVTEPTGTTTTGVVTEPTGTTTIGVGETTKPTTLATVTQTQPETTTQTGTTKPTPTQTIQVTDTTGTTVTGVVTVTEPTGQTTTGVVTQTQVVTVTSSQPVTYTDVVTQTTKPEVITTTLATTKPTQTQTMVTDTTSGVTTTGTVTAPVQTTTIGTTPTTKPQTTLVTGTTEGTTTTGFVTGTATTKPTPVTTLITGTTGTTTTGVVIDTTTIKPTEPQTTLVTGTTLGTTTTTAKPTTPVQTTTAAHNEPCTEPLGMEGGQIKPDQITASSQLDDQHSPDEGTLNGPSAWKPDDTDVNPSITVDLLEPTHVTGFITQGKPETNEFVTTYTVYYSNDGVNFVPYTDEFNKPVTFTANSDSTTPVTNLLDVSRPITAQYIQLRPTSWNEDIAMQEPLGMESGEIKPDQITASSVYPDPIVSHGPEQAILNNLPDMDGTGAWSPAPDDVNPYIQVDLGELVQVTGFITQGRPEYTPEQYVTEYTVYYSIDGINFIPYTDETNTPVVFNANTDTTTPVTNLVSISRPILAQYVQIHPQSYNEYPSMQLEILGCRVNEPTTTQLYTTTTGTQPVSTVVVTEGTTTTIKPGTLTPTLETTTLHPVTTTFGEVTPTEEVVTFTTTTSGEPSTTIAVTSPTTTKPTPGVVTEQTTTTGVVTQTSIVTEKPTPTTTAAVTTGTTTTQTKPTTPVQTTTPNNEPCREPMGLENGLIKPDQITASSHLDDQHRPEDVVLNNPTGAWRPVTNDQTQYLQVDLGELTHVTGFITQGEPETTNYVTTYYITFSTDGVNFVPYTDDGKVVTFAANTDSTTPVTNLLDLSRPITAQYIQIHPVTWNDNIALQAEILGCGVTTTPATTIFSTEPTPGTVTIGTVTTSTLSTATATTLGTTIQTTGKPTTTGAITQTQPGTTTIATVPTGQTTTTGVVTEPIGQTTTGSVTQTQPGTTTIATVPTGETTTGVVTVPTGQTTTGTVTLPTATQTQVVTTTKPVTATGVVTETTKPEVFTTTGVVTQTQVVTVTSSQPVTYTDVVTQTTKPEVVTTTLATTKPTQTQTMVTDTTSGITTTGVVTGTATKPTEPQTTLITGTTLGTTTTGIVTETTTTAKPTTPVQTTTAAHNEPCTEPLGMEGGQIKPDQITASSQLDDQHSPDEGTLNGPSAWKPDDTDVNPSITVDLLEPTHVTGFITQGKPETNEFVTTYTVYYSNDGVNFVPYTDEFNKPVTFTANSDSTTPVTNLLDVSRPITAQYIQLRPTSWNENIAMQVEVLGCKGDSTTGTTIVMTTTTPVGPLPCQEPLGMESGEIKPEQITASSVYPDPIVSHGPEQAVLNNLPDMDGTGAWSPAPDDVNPYIQVDLGELVQVTGFITQGRPEYTPEQYVTEYTVYYSIDGINFIPYTDETNTPVVFNANTDTTTPVTNLVSISRPILAQYVQIHPQSHNNYPSMQLEILGCRVNEPTTTAIVTTTVGPVVTTKPTTTGAVTVTEQVTTTKPITGTSTIAGPESTTTLPIGTVTTGTTTQQTTTPKPTTATAATTTVPENPTTTKPITTAETTVVTGTTTIAGEVVTTTLPIGEVTTEKPTTTQQVVTDTTTQQVITDTTTQQVTTEKPTTTTKPIQTTGTTIQTLPTLPQETTTTLPGVTTTAVVVDTGSTQTVTKPTTQTTTTKPFNAPLCAENYPYWTPYMNGDRPNTNQNDGDIELIDSLRPLYTFCPTEMIDDIRCREVGTGAMPTENMVQCDHTTGLMCFNAVQPDGSCEDYEVSFHCACGPETTTVAETTTTPGTTTAATTTTQKPVTTTLATETLPTQTTTSVSTTVPTTTGTTTIKPGETTICADYNPCAFTCGSICHSMYMMYTECYGKPDDYCIAACTDIKCPPGTFMDNQNGQLTCKPEGDCPCMLEDGTIVPPGSSWMNPDDSRCTCFSNDIQCMNPTTQVITTTR
ncbi:hypothetical protein Bbelb_070140, partial [Branchiostoma belcheri]